MTMETQFREVTSLLFEMHNDNEEDEEKWRRVDFLSPIFKKTKGRWI